MGFEPMTFPSFAKCKRDELPLRHSPTLWYDQSVLFTHQQTQLSIRVVLTMAPLATLSSLTRIHAHMLSQTERV